MTGRQASQRASRTPRTRSQVASGRIERPTASAAPPRRSAASAIPADDAERGTQKNESENESAEQSGTESESRDEQALQTGQQRTTNRTCCCRLGRRRHRRAIRCAVGLAFVAGLLFGGTVAFVGTKLHSNLQHSVQTIALRQDLSSKQAELVELEESCLKTEQTLNTCAVELRIQRGHRQQCEENLEMCWTKDVERREREQAALLCKFMGCYGTAREATAGKE